MSKKCIMYGTRRLEHETVKMKSLSRKDSRDLRSTCILSRSVIYRLRIVSLVMEDLNAECMHVQTNKHKTGRMSLYKGKSCFIQLIAFSNIKQYFSFIFSIIICKANEYYIHIYIIYTVFQPVGSTGLSV